MTDISTSELKALTSGGGPRVTVVMPTYRRPHQIGSSIRSLLMQTWTSFELLVRDDGDGNDGTAAAVSAAGGGDRRVRYHRNMERLGMPGNLNRGILESQGEFIAVCHDHDLYTPSFLAEMVGTLIRHPTALFVHCAIDIITQGGVYSRSLIGDWPEFSPGSSWMRFMLSRLHCPVCALTVVRRDAHDRYGLYDPSYSFIADIEMWMRLALHGDVAYVCRPLIQVREREADHGAAANGASLVYIAARIHRRYIRHAYKNPERPVRRLMLELRLFNQLFRHQAAQMKQYSLSKLRMCS